MCIELAFRVKAVYVAFWHILQMLYTFTLQLATLMFVNVAVNVQSFTWSEPESQLNKLNTSCERV